MVANYTHQIAGFVLITFVTSQGCGHSSGKPDGNPTSATASTQSAVRAEPATQHTRPPQDDVIPRRGGTPKYLEAIKELKLAEDQALQVAVRDYEIRKAQGLFVEAMDGKPLALIGRKYLFGKPYKAKLLLRGYLVDGDSGAVEWYDGGEWKEKSILQNIIENWQI